MSILIFGGTTEGRLLAGELAAAGEEVTVSVATELGAEELKGTDCQVLTGRMTPEEMEQVVVRYDKVIDATHPYAEIVTQNVKAACEKTQVPYERIEREASSAHVECVRVASVEEAANYLVGKAGNILVTTGSKELRKFAVLPPEQVFARVLPTHEALDICEELQLPHRNIIALQGPFTRELNEAMIRQYSIRWMVSKDGGSIGGFEEKLASAEATGVNLILVDRPKTN